jgi:hypothetical protein
MMARPPSCVLRLRIRTEKGIMVSIGVLYTRKHALSVGGTMTRPRMQDANSTSQEGEGEMEGGER